MKKRVLVLTLCVLLVLVTGGCGSKESVNETPTLTWYVHGDKQQDVASVMEEVNKITEENIGARVDLQFIDQAAYSEKMTMMMASRTDFDLCFTGYVNSYSKAIERGGLLQLDEYLEKMPELKASIPGYVWDTVNYNGGIYAVPNLQIIGYQLNMYTFKDLAEKYDLDELNIKKMEDAEPYLQKIKENEPDYYPFRANYGTMAFECADYQHQIATGVNVYFDENGKLTDISTQIEMDAYRNAVDKIHDWYKKGYIRTDIASVTDDSQDQNMCRYAVWIEKYKPGIAEEHKIKYNREVVSYPISPNILKNSAPDAMTGISKTSKNPVKAMQLLQEVNNNKELFNLISYGIKDKHYSLDANGRVVYIDGSGYAPKAAWKFGNQFNALLLPGQPEDVWEQTAKMNDEALRSPLVGFTFNTYNVTNEISQVSTINSEYSVAGKGAENPDKYFDTMKQRMKSAGVDKIRDEVEKQYNEWKNAQ